MSAEGFSSEYATNEPSRFEFVAKTLSEAEVRLFAIGKEVILPAPDLQVP